MQWTSAPNIGEAPLPQRARSYWKARFSAAHDGIEKILEAERAQLPPWFVVAFGSGIAAWFALDGPREWAALLCVTAALALFGFVLGSGRAGRALGWFALAATAGCGLVWARSEWVAQRWLERPLVTAVAGRIESVDYLAAKQAVRLMLRPSDGRLPPRIRVSIDEDKLPAGIASGAEVALKARLAPPPPMALPGTYDFARDAWFKRIGAVGKATGPVTVVRPAQPHGLDRARDGLRHHIAASLPAHPAGIAIALATGDRNSVDEDDADAMRRSGLTHLLSVSGLHIAAVVAFAMFLTLKLLALSERLALRFNLVLVAAAAAAAAGIGYTLLGDGKHLAVVGADGTPFILRDRAGDYVRSLVAEASGFDGDPAALYSRPFSACSKDSCVALLRKGANEWRLLATRSATQIDWVPFTRACADADISFPTAVFREAACRTGSSSTGR